MKLSLRWLGRHVDLSGLSPEGLAEDLTMSTAEVEGVEPFLPHLADVAVGHVASCERHPAADKLSLCRVDLGAGEPLQIVCGATNVAAGQKVAVATAGTALPGDLKIKKTRIRGVDSHGMICSERELGLSDEHEGIWVLSADAPVGRPVREALDLEDWVIEIDNKSITHRPDLWGHRGIAVEIAAIHRRAVKPLDLRLPPSDFEPDLASYPVRIESPDCLRYVALAIDGARAERSPDWLRFLLLAVGQRPIDGLVDLSNFVMLDLGQPNHLFDRGRLSPEGILVRAAREGERMRTLDGAERRLFPSDLLITSGGEPVALAGVMGGEGSRVEADTSSLLLEVATFRAAAVRRTSARLFLRTDSSARFEKSLDPMLPMVAAKHFGSLLALLQPEARIAAPPTDVGPCSGEWVPDRTIELRAERVRALLGAPVPDGEIADILDRLLFEVTPREPGVFSVGVPSHRATKDIEIEADLVEEVGRLYRYGNIPERALEGVIAPAPRDERRALVRRIEDRLSGGARFHQTISYSFASDETLRKLGLLELPHVEVTNPVAEGLSRVRRSVAPSLLAALALNRRHREEVRLFEIGKGYLPERANESGEPGEVHELALLWAAPPPSAAARWDADCLHRLQGVLEDLFASLDLEAVAWSPAAPGAAPGWAHPGRCLAGRAGEVELAALAALEPGVARALGLSGELSSDVALAAVSIDTLLTAPRRERRYRPIPRHPGIKVDVALALPEAVAAAGARGAIERAGKGLVASAELFDLYSGESLGPGRKSLAWHVLLLAEGRTLTDADAQRFLARLEREAASLGGELRRE